MLVNNTMCLVLEGVGSEALRRGIIPDFFPSSPTVSGIVKNPPKNVLFHVVSGLLVLARGDPQKVKKT